MDVVEQISNRAHVHDDAKRFQHDSFDADDSWMIAEHRLQFDFMKELLAGMDI